MRLVSRLFYRSFATTTTTTTTTSTTFAAQSYSSATSFTTTTTFRTASFLAMTTTDNNDSSNNNNKTDTNEYVPPKVWTWDAPKNDNQFAQVNRPTAGPRFDKELPKGDHALQVYSLATPNGQKVTILLEELLALGITAAEYDAWLIKIGDLDQFGSGFVSVNPNSKIPAVLDYAPSSSSTTPMIRIFESGSILLYLADKFAGQHDFLPTLDDDGAARTEVMNWLFWQMGSAPYVGGGFGHFYAYANEKQEYPINRFTMETKRQLDVLNRQLATSTYIASDTRYTIADMAIFPWYGSLVLGKGYKNADVFLNVQQDYPHVIRWAKQIEARPAVQRGCIVNKVWGDGAQLAERHSAADIDRALNDAAEPVSK